MKLTHKPWIALTAATMLLLVPGCAKKGADVETTPEAARPVTPVTPTPTPPPPPVEVVDDTFKPRNEPIERPKLSIAELNDSGVLQTVYFDFDRSELSGISQTILRRNADWLKNNREYSVAIEGHCDSRGTIEYNLALGQRRANAVREFLYGQGVSLSRLRTVSYGEEKPAAQGSGETAWSKNRRAEFDIEE